jgi:hypothetical protein
LAASALRTHNTAKKALITLSPHPLVAHTNRQYNVLSGGGARATSLGLRVEDRDHAAVAAFNAERDSFAPQLDRLLDACDKKAMVSFGFAHHWTYDYFKKRLRDQLLQHGTSKEGGVDALLGAIDKWASEVERCGCDGGIVRNAVKAEVRNMLAARGVGGGGGKRSSDVGISSGAFSAKTNRAADAACKKAKTEERTDEEAAAAAAKVRRLREFRDKLLVVLRIDKPEKYKDAAGLAKPKATHEASEDAAQKFFEQVAAGAADPERKAPPRPYLPDVEGVDVGDELTALVGEFVSPPSSSSAQDSNVLGANPYQQLVKEWRAEIHNAWKRALYG